MAAKNEMTEELAQKNDPMRPVKIKLFRDGQKYKDALYVNLNNRNYIIPRGVNVTVPYCVAKHIAEMTAQDESTAQMVELLETEYDSLSKKYEG